MNKNIRYSKEESTFFGLRIGRFVGQCSSAVDFRREVVAGEYDIVRIRVNEQETGFIDELRHMGFDIDDQGGIINYELPVDKLQYQDYLNPEVGIRVYDGSDPQFIKRIISEGNSEYPIGYFSTPKIESYISVENEVEYLGEYYSKLYINSEKQLWYIEWDGEPVAFVASDFYDGIMMTPLCVVLPEFRERKIFHDLMTSRNNYGVKHGLCKICNGARTDNSTSRYVFEKFGMQKVGTDRVFHLTSMLSSGKRTPT